MRKAYISGKITGDDGWQEKFRAAQRALEADGWTVLSPLLLRDVALDYQDYLAIDYAMIGVCDAVAFLPDWEQSPGARAEFDVASAGRKQVIYLAGGTVCSDGRLCSKEDGDDEPDWLKKYGIASTDNVVRASVEPFDSVQELLDAGANEYGVLWLKRLAGGAEYMVTVLDREDGTVRIDDSTYTLAELTTVFTFLDGSVCGKIGIVR